MVEQLPSNNIVINENKPEEKEISVNNEVQHEQNIEKTEHTSD